MGRSAQPGIERRREILRILQSRNSVSISELSLQLGISQSSIRRDLEVLERKEAIMRAARGTVVARKPPLRFLFARAGPASKHTDGPHIRIGRYAAQLVSPEETIFVNHGPATLELVRELVRRSMPVTVITSSLAIACELWGQELVRTLLVGGQLPGGRVEVSGSVACHSLQILAANVAFIACDGASSVRGIGFDDAERGQMAASMLANAGRKCVLADATRLGRIARFSLPPTAEIDLVITDASVPRLHLRQLVEASVDVRVVDGRADSNGCVRSAESGVDLLARESSGTAPAAPDYLLEQQDPRALIGAGAS